MKMSAEGGFSNIVNFTPVEDFQTAVWRVRGWKAEQGNDAS